MAVKKVELKFKQVGRNLNVTIDGKSFTKVGSKEELAPVKEALKLAQEKGTKKNVDAVIKLLTPKAEAKAKEVEKTKADIKRVKRSAEGKAKKPITKESDFEHLQAKIKTANLTDKEKAELRKALGVEEAKPAPVPQATQRRGGEW